MPRMKTELTAEDIDVALHALDAMFGESPLLMSVAPIRFMVVGGTMAVKYFQVRSMTKDVDYLTDPNIDSDKMYRAEIRTAVQRVANQLDMEEDWFNDEVKLWIHAPKRLGLFLESVEQNIVIFQGASMTIYAARLDWQLERKLRRITNGKQTAQSNKDISDAVAILSYLKGDGPPLRAADLEAMNFNGFEGSMSKGVKKVKEEYKKRFEEDGIVD
ncbi:hypothetical protein PG994_014841 [Apiospora phragmitis]|uniref:DUF7582 domain-containing protein n=1 Tax=Apiospora phragmitis TaxID=2905665 RepID=A0ABR1SWF6_9PEZI